MYPADHDWGDGSDLPDAITLILPQEIPLILNAIRNGDEFYVADPVYWSAITFAPDPETGYSPRQYFRIKKEMGYLGLDFWIVQFRYEDGQDWYGGGIYFQPCLIIGDGNLTPGDGMVEDQFAASYTVNFNGPFPDRGLPATQTFVRESLCVWKSTSGYDYGNGIITYDTLTYGGGALPHYDLTKWAVNATNMLATSMVKTGAQNSPIGTYSSQFYPSIQPITVSL